MNAKFTFGGGYRGILDLFVQNERTLFWRYLRLLRYEEYYQGRNRFIGIIYTRRKNKLGNRYGIKVMPAYAGMGVNIHHKNIIINGIIGENCIFHGNNCIGNNGTIDGIEQIPRIGNNVDFGYGSVVIGKVDIADDIKIGAGAVVVNSFTEKGITIAGIPARKIVPKPCE